MWITGTCIEAGPCSTSQLREELSQISFQTLHSISEIFKGAYEFWRLSAEIIMMLDKQVSSGYLNYGASVTN